MRHLVLSALLLIPAAPVPADGPEVVTLETDDGMTLEADWYPGEEGYPGVVALHMYRSDRSAWRPLAEARLDTMKFGILALDLRGHGESKVQDGVDLSKRVEERDPELFRNMWRDALAAVEWLRTKGKCDPKRIGIVGASVGCSVAVDAAVRDGKIAGVVLLTPGTNYLGVPTMEHAKSWKDTPLLILSSEEERKVGAERLAEALKEHPEVELRIVPGEKIHGTRMFGSVPDLEKSLWAWLRATAGRLLLDGAEDGTEKGVRDGWAGGWGSAGNDPGPGRAGTWSAWSDIKALNIQASETGFIESSTTFEVQVEVVGSPTKPEGPGIHFRGTASDSGAPAILVWRVKSTSHWEDEKSPVPTESLVRFRKGVLEVRVPWDLIPATGGERIRLSASGLGGGFRGVVNGENSLEVPKW